MRFLDRFEETFVSLLMAFGVTLIFVAVIHRFSASMVADILQWARANDYPEIQAHARSVYRSLVAFRLTWVQEACIYAFVWMAKFGAAYGVRLGIHVGVDVLVSKLSREWAKRMTVISFLGCILFTSIVTWIGADFVWHISGTGQISADLQMPMWIVYLAVPLGSALMCFRFIQALWIFLRTGEVAHHDHTHVAGTEEQEGIRK